MLNVNDFKLVSLEALVHDEALFKSYLALIEAVGEIYDIENLNVSGEIDLGDDYVWEDQVMDGEIGFWRSWPCEKTAQNFLKWFDDKEKLKRSFNDGHQCKGSILVRISDPSKVLGRAELWSGLEDETRLGAGYDCIHPDYRGQGLGRVIYAHRLVQAHEEGVQEMRVNIKDDNESSLRRFQKFEARGYAYDYKFVRNKTIAWIKPDFTLNEAYAVLTGQDAAPSENELSL